METDINYGATHCLDCGAGIEAVEKTIADPVVDGGKPFDSDTDIRVVYCSDCGNILDTHPDRPKTPRSEMDGPKDADPIDLFGHTISPLFYHGRTAVRYWMCMEIGCDATGRNLREDFGEVPCEGTTTVEPKRRLGEGDR